MNNTFLLFYSPKPRSKVWIVKIGLLTALSKPVSRFCCLCITRLVTFLLAFAHFASVPCSIFGALAVDLWQIYWTASSGSCEFSQKNVQLTSCHGPYRNPLPPFPSHAHEHHCHNNVMLSLLSVLERHFPFLAFEAVKHGGNNTIELVTMNEIHTNQRQRIYGCLLFTRGNQLLHHFVHRL